MKRFIYAGCSYTNFAYPTWGDIIAYDLLKYKGFDTALNLGKGGACNSYIAHQLLLVRDKINIKSDHIGVNWSTPDRLSYVTNPPKDIAHSIWVTNGSVSHGGNAFHEDHLLNINSGHSCLMRTFDAYNSINAIFNIQFQSKMDIKSDGKELYEYLNEPPMKNQFQRAYMIDTWENYNNLPAFKMQTDPAWGFENDEVLHRLHSSHPDMIAHLNHAQTIADLHPDTIDMFTNLHYKFVKDLKKVYSKLDTSDLKTAQGIHIGEELKHEINEELKRYQVYQKVWDLEPYNDNRLKFAEYDYKSTKFSNYNPDDDII